jgi:hypothetical protein
MATTAAVHPGVLWAQRQKLVFVTIEVSDVEKPEIKVRGLKETIPRVLLSREYFVLISVVDPKQGPKMAF